MISKKGLLRGSNLQVILDNDTIGDRLILKTARLAASAGADMIQLRAKGSSISDMIKLASAVKKIAARYKKTFIINDRLEVALAVGADGIHLGKGDVSVRIARRLLGRSKLIGVSVKSIKDAQNAMIEGADYLGAGAVFKTPIKRIYKPKGFSLIGRLKKIGLPFFAIGGIDCGNIGRLAGRGFKNVAVIRAVCKAQDPGRATIMLKEAIG